MYRLNDEETVVSTYKKREDAEAMREFLIERYMEWEFRDDTDADEDFIDDTRMMFEETVFVAEVRAELSKEQVIGFVNKEHVDDLTVG